jgi:hypothetical protein
MSLAFKKKGFDALPGREGRKKPPAENRRLLPYTEAARRR